MGKFFRSEKGAKDSPLLNEDCQGSITQFSYFSQQIHNKDASPQLLIFYAMAFLGIRVSSENT